MAHSFIRLALTLNVTWLCASPRLEGDDGRMTHIYGRDKSLWITGKHFLDEGFFRGLRVNAVGECGHVDISRREQYGSGYIRERSHKFQDNCKLLWKETLPWNKECSSRERSRMTEGFPFICSLSKQKDAPRDSAQVPGSGFNCNDLRTPRCIFFFFSWSSLGIQTKTKIENNKNNKPMTQKF